MNPAIEQIVSSDEAARATVERAEKDAAMLINDAGEEAKSMLAALEKQIRETEQSEITPIVSDGQQQAELTVGQAEQYIERLRQKLDLKKKEIIAAFINNAVKAGMD
jgi:vacuolar-type H+-ATPase subunit H